MLEKLDNGTWLATDADGTQWICQREPEYNGAKWFVALKGNEGYKNVMRRKI